MLDGPALFRPASAAHGDETAFSGLDSVLELSLESAELSAATDRSRMTSSHDGACHEGD